MPPFELRSETIKPAIFWTAQLGINVTETLFSDIDAKKSQHIFFSNAILAFEPIFSKYCFILIAPYHLYE